MGALHNPLAVPPWAKVSYVDRAREDELARSHQELGGSRFVPVDIVDDGEKLATISAESQDFVIANGFLEHCQDPLGTIAAFVRVLRPEGAVYLATPDKRYTFDSRRPVTPLAHLLRDHREGPEWSRLWHFEEWVRLVEGVEDPQAVRSRAQQLMSEDYSIHYHVWTQGEMLEMIATLRNDLGLPFDLELMVRFLDECVFILRKHAL